MVAGADWKRAMRHGWLALLLLLCAVAMALAVALLPPFPQPQDYHRFADARAWFGMPNFLDVVSNLMFLAVAVTGLVAVLRPGRAAFIDRAEHLPYVLFFVALAATSFGSAWYHLAPDNARLFWDRLPINICFAALLSAAIAERYSIKAGLLLLLPLVAVGAGTVCGIGCGARCWAAATCCPISRSRLMRCLPFCC